ncbi:MAG: hypothetical protein LKI24_15520 [Acidipropionibacterium sp.]|nr:hypothetical protein [Acidipropionibacterium sp.]
MRTIAKTTGKRSGIQNQAPPPRGTMPPERATPTIALISGDQRLVELVGSVAASVGVGVDAVSDRGGAQAVWSLPGPLLIGQDRASAVVAWQLPRRSGDVHLVGEDAAEAARWSAVLGASVIVVPASTPTLIELLREGFRESGTGVVLLVDQSSGGLGATTMAAGIAREAAVGGMRAALVELDAAGGGADLLLGVERESGWRWPELASARGAVSDLTPHLPAADGVAVVSVGRDRLEIPAAARVSVVRSLAAELDLGGAGPWAGGRRSDLRPGSRRPVRAGRRRSSLGDGRPGAGGLSR